ncbi:DUF6701 domain-containing protein [Flavobacterium sp. W21_SRS_FM6]|uniref:DUF6701 domain-containing protein n=1 Tax=Flavobacterium sp. W21_SRS_FM6 TaxID=3240268 RepID=UPI003F93F311
MQNPAWQKRFQRNLNNALSLLLLSLFWSVFAAASSIKGYLTADNRFDVYFSTDDSVRGVYLGSGSDWRTTYTFDYNLDNNKNYYLHIVARNDGDIAGFIGQFNLSGSGHVFGNGQSAVNSDVSNWKVSKTGWGNYTAPSRIQGTNGVSPWGTRPSISSSASWIWTSAPYSDSLVYFSLPIRTQSTTPSLPQCNSVFPSVAQSHVSSGQLYIDVGAKFIAPPSTALPFYRVNVNSPIGTSCDTAECSATGSAAASLTLPSFPANSSTRNYIVTNGTLGQGIADTNFFGDIYIDGGYGRFSSDFSTYYIRKLIIQNRGKLYLKPGTYWVEQLTMDGASNQGDLQINVEGAGEVYLYIKNSAVLGSKTEINGLRENAALSLNLYNNFTLNSYAKASGLIYVNGNMIAGSSTVVSGVMSSNNLQLNPYVQVRYQSSTLNDFDFAKVCEKASSSNLIAFYKFEASDWQNSNSVQDSSLNANHGSPLGDVSSQFPMGDQKSCRVLDVPSSSSVISNTALNTNINVKNDIGSRGTISFWYRSNAPWNDAIARQLFDASTWPADDVVSAKWFYMSLSSGILQFGIEDTNDDDLVVSATGLNYAADDWVHVAATWDMQVGKVQLYLNGNRVATRILSNLSGQLPPLNTLYIGDNRSNYIFVYPEYTPSIVSTQNSANGQFDDVRIYKTVQADSDIVGDMNSLAPCDFVDHFRIEHDGQGLTCETEVVTIKACTDSDCTDAALYDQSTSLTLSPGTWNGTDTVDFVGSTAVNLSIVTAGSYTLSKTGSSIDAPLRCFKGSVETCDIEFVDAGFEFIGATANDKILPDQVAETNFSNIQLRAVQNTNGVCKAALNGSRAITFGYDCDSPNTCLTPLAAIPISNANGESTGSVNLSFNSDGIASLSSLQYGDAGRLKLSAQTTLNGAQIIRGTGFVDVYPAYLQLNVSPNTLILSGAGDSGVFTAGAPFEFHIGAYGALDNLLPNYQPEQLKLKVQRLAPLAVGTVDGQFKYGGSASAVINSSLDAQGFSALDSLEFNQGVYAFNGAYYTETGQISLNVMDVSYLGNPIRARSEVTLDPFIPAYYAVEALSSSPSLLNVQTHFTYVGQAISFSQNPIVKIAAKNALDDTTLNNDSSAWLLRPSALDLTYIDKSVYGGDWTVNNSPTPLIVGDNNYDGSVFVEVSGTTITYNKVDENGVMHSPVDPFGALLDIVLTVPFFTDINGVCFRDNYADNTCNDFTYSDVSGADLRFGRFNMNGTHGPAADSLTVPFSAQYYQGGQWLTNTLDSDSLINFSEANGQLLLSKRGNASANDLTGLIDSVSSSGSLLSGVPMNNNDFTLSAPGQVGEVLLRLNPVLTPLAWPSYLNYDWNADGYICNEASTCLGSEGVDYPNAVITFGQFRGNDRVIQWREIFN